MANVQTLNETGKLKDRLPVQATQESFNALMSQLNWAIVKWGRIWTDHASGRVKAYQDARAMLSACFPAQAEAYETEFNESEVTNG